MLEDGEDKIRRNLVVSSVLVLNTAWLGLPVADLLERLLATRTDGGIEIEPWKVWVSAVVLLTYFALRYRFSAATASLGTRLEEFRREWRKGASESLFRRRLLEHLRGGAHHRLLSLDNEPLDLAEVERVCEGANMVLVDLFPHHRWHDVHATVDANDVQKNITARLRPLDRRMIVFKSWFLQLFYSRYAIELILPIALWGAAMSVALFNAASALMSR